MRAAGAVGAILYEDWGGGSCWSGRRRQISFEFTYTEDTVIRFSLSFVCVCVCLYSFHGILMCIKATAAAAAGAL